MVGMGVSENDAVDLVRFEAGGFEISGETPCGRPENLRRAHPRVEQQELAPGVQDECVLPQHDVVGGQEVVREELLQLLLGRAFEGAGGRAERERPVGDDGALEIAQPEPVPSRRLRACEGSGRPRGKSGGETGGGRADDEAAAIERGRARASEGGRGR